MTEHLECQYDAVAEYYKLKLKLSLTPLEHEKLRDLKRKKLPGWLIQNEE